MTLDPSQWRSASQYDYVETLDAPDLAWEWLRRNARYQSDFAKGSAPGRLTRHVRRRWGLRFPGRSEAERSRSGHLLAARDRSGDGHFDRRPAVRGADKISSTDRP
ncbi:DUF6499 domain-containing protein [Aurantimonas sp. C2-6-R+9]|uniref:transcriptional regulator domain-containing protein n=1 Tax=unclassified Aurantimonas TaxID=2638230 RepID=UPI002E18964B|nr:MULTISPECIES: DUF6499 domain-containing protein [unclassified Aurantimonas]MEC5292243.1 DUF6499 domain-containing protein [Aurantimonas sp. C2-3-R2]MEC5382458.1 DUF6499 domain-containing protein [Aurantimonas sp. C2-6-R+9]MEC5413328.1 DUF6499 domain-containing protein [Aurantimonas sp. C2-4-R8]